MSDEEKIRGKNRRKKKKTEPVDAKQIMKSMGIFFLILTSLMLIPVIASLVVILIKGLMDIRYIIIIGGGLLLAAFVFWLIRWMIRMFRRLRKSSHEMEGEFGAQMDYADTTEITVLGGLFKVKYNGKRNNLALPDAHDPRSLRLSIPQTTGEAGADVVLRLQLLSDLKNAGEIDEAEYQTLKHQLIYPDSIEIHNE